MSIAERLSAAINARYANVLQFQQAVAREEEGGRTIRGTSYPAIVSYLKGEVTPNLGFLLAAARVLGVRPAWLALGEGQQTEAEEATRAASTEGLVTEDRSAEIERLLATEFDAYHELSPWSRAAIWEVLHRWQQSEYTLLRAEPLTEDFSHLDPLNVMADAAQQVGMTLKTSFDFFGGPAASQQELDTYVVSVCTGLMQLIATPKERYEREYKRIRRLELLPSTNRHLATIEAEKAKKTKEQRTPQGRAKGRHRRD